MGLVDTYYTDYYCTNARTISVIKYKPRTNLQSVQSVRQANIIQAHRQVPRRVEANSILQPDRQANIQANIQAHRSPSRHNIQDEPKPSKPKPADSRIHIHEQTNNHPSNAPATSTFAKSSSCLQRIRSVQQL